MPQAEDYRERWNDIGAGHFPEAASAGIASNLADFLEEFFSLVDLTPFATNLPSAMDLNGLLIPREAPPFLNLESEDMLLQQPPELEGRYSLYSDNCGNPICIEPPSSGSAVVWLDHEQDFSGRVFVNSNVVAFAETLLIASAIKLGRHDYAERMTTLDPAAMVAGTFWSVHLPSLT